MSGRRILLAGGCVDRETFWTLGLQMGLETLRVPPEIETHSDVNLTIKDVFLEFNWVITALFHFLAHAKLINTIGFRQILNF